MTKGEKRIVWGIFIIACFCIVCFIVSVVIGKEDSKCAKSWCDNKASDGSVYCRYHERTYTSNTTKSTTSYSYKSSAGTTKAKTTAKRKSTDTKKYSDPYDVDMYCDPEDFYYDNYDDFWDYEDAEDYYNEYYD